MNRYERIVDFDFSAGDRYWERTSVFWQDVRAAWADAFVRHPEFRFDDDFEGKALFEPMFEYAARLEAGEAYDPRDGRAFIRATLTNYIE